MSQPLTPHNNPEHTRMRRYNIPRAAALAAAIACIAGGLIASAHAADKGGPAEPPKVIDAQGNEKALFTGCYGQVGGSGFFADGNNTTKGFLIGAGCDWQLSGIVIGLNGKYGLYEEDARSLTFGGRLGYTLNPHTLFYAHAGALMDGKSPSLKDSAIYGGLGLETYVNRNITLFFEAATDLQKWGDAKTMPSIYEVNGGIRIRF